MFISGRESMRICKNAFLFSRASCSTELRLYLDPYPQCARHLSPHSVHPHNQTKPPHYSLRTAFSPLLPSVPTPASKIRRPTSRSKRASFQKIRYILSIVKRCQFKVSRGPRKFGLLKRTGVSSTGSVSETFR